MTEETRKRGRPRTGGSKSKSGSKPTYSLVATADERAFDAMFSERYFVPKSRVWHSGHKIVELLSSGERDINKILRCMPISRNPIDWPTTTPDKAKGVSAIAVTK